MGGQGEKITITAEKGRLSEEDIERMVREAEEYADEDKKVKERIDARNGLESYLYNMKNTLDDDGRASPTNCLLMTRRRSRTRLTRPSTGWTKILRPTRTSTRPSKRRSRPSRTRS